MTGCHRSPQAPSRGKMVRLWKTSERCMGSRGLRFQKDDGIDAERKDNRTAHAFLMIFCFVVVAVIAGIGAWFSGKSLPGYERDMAELLAFILFGWLVLPIHEEQRSRAKQTYGLVADPHNRLADLQRQVSQIEDELRGLKYAQRQTSGMIWTVMMSRNLSAWLGDMLHGRVYRLLDRLRNDRGFFSALARDACRARSSPPSWAFSDTLRSGPTSDSLSSRRIGSPLTHRILCSG